MKRVALTLAFVSAVARAGGDHDAKIRAIVAEPGDPVQVGIWFGPPPSPIYTLMPDRPLPAASVVKSALLVELFAARAGHLDEPLPADTGPAGAPSLTARTVGAIMMGSQKASVAVYNGAANVVIQFLGGPAAATAKIHARDAAYAGIAVRRYMLASRTANGDNEATPAALAAVLAAIATGKVPGVDAATAAAVAETLMRATDPTLGERRHKEGSLDSDPMTCVKTGYYLPRGKPPLIYVVGVALSAKPSGSRDAAHRRLEKMTDDLLAALGAEAW